ncbi:hypothetical protein GN244_ATG15871 [Phytophthora infestans]|uniref:Uncharacterized protein n=1 Tax=Phytophthora infestans TaxID=4787 RepID=A0A833SRY6_PHYIN|nr:hypothetical protein GN244_ATG15871 [Phytophthora infestans]KAF4147179.1 hypothetical protein GN958_ATG03589 [Phytophthora infestans]
MDAASREIQWLKKIMKGLGDDQNSDCSRPTMQKTTEHSATQQTTASYRDDDDSELDRLMRRAVLLLRIKATNAQRDIVLFGEDGKASDESTDGEDRDEELDELLQRAALLLRQRLGRQSQRGVKAVAVTAEATLQQEVGDEELDRLLRRAMLLFNKLSTREQNAEIDAELDDVRLKMISVVKGSASPGSPGATDGEDYEEEEDDELDQLLRREMAELRHQSSSPVEEKVLMRSRM